MKSQRELINNKNWDILLILDACRFDFFKEHYQEIMGKSGTLKKASSPAAWTLGWMIEIFDEGILFDDTIFISANPDVSSRGIEEKILDWSKRWKYAKIKFEARDHFKKIIDVWNFGYDKTLDAVHPQTMIDIIKETVKENPECKIIAKFNQIHDPYLYFIERGHKVAGSENFFVRNITDRKGINIKKFLNLIFNDEVVWRVRKLLGIIPKSGIALLWLKYGKQEIIKGYQKDLEDMLEYFKGLMLAFPNKRIVITSDHGELLGEYKRYGHHTDKKFRELVEVPWYER